MESYTYKFRIYPNKQQEIKLEKHFGSTRFVYNYFLNQRINAYQENDKSLNYNDNAKELTKLKKELEWLNEINAQALQQALKHLETAYKNFFKKQTKFPKFKSKKDKQSFKIPQNVKVQNNKLYIGKFKEGIKLRLHRQIEGIIRNATISKNKANQYFVCIYVQKNIEKYLPNENQVGIDLGIKTLVTCSDGIIYPNIRTYRNLEKRRRILAKALSRTKKGSKGREKAIIKLARLDLKIMNIRNDYLHKISHEIVRNNQVIIMEYLNVTGIIQNRKLSKSIWDCSFYELVRQIQYKCLWYGREFIQVSRWFPSSKMCNNCENINKELTLKDRSWTCPICSTSHDRDINAAINILNQGKRTVGITGIADCLDVRPM